MTFVREKILERALSKRFELVRDDITKKLDEFKNSDPDKLRELGISYEWLNENTLLMKSEMYNILGYLLIWDQNLVVYVDVPSYLMPLYPLFLPSLKEKLEAEIDKLLTT
jgi:hypothetical protein